ncbi:MAG: signal peptide peptidase SppA [Proteobacteria bacterium]|nr:MAG: signal peptide peptidase SppA [Pseudomonadota bacterium]
MFTSIYRLVGPAGLAVYLGRRNPVMKEYFVWLFKILTLVVLALVVLPAVIAIVAGLSDDGLGGALAGDGKSVAVVEVRGIIDDAKEVLEDLYKQSDNEKIKAIVLRIDSPGGAVGPSQEIYEAVNQLKSKKPIVASMGAVAASGGLYAALSATKVFCQPGTITGSIGVILQIPNFTKVSQELGVDMITIKSGKLKDVGNAFREMTPEERAFMEDTVHKAHNEFIDAVVRGRGLDQNKVREFADGRVILGTEAKELKLVDDFGDVFTAARAALELAGSPLRPEETPKLLYSKDPYGKFMKFIEGIADLPYKATRGFELSYLMN